MDYYLHEAQVSLIKLLPLNAAELGVEFIQLPLTRPDEAEHSNYNKRDCRLEHFMCKKPNRPPATIEGRSTNKARRTVGYQNGKNQQNDQYN